MGADTNRDEGVALILTLIFVFIGFYLFHSALLQYSILRALALGIIFILLIFMTLLADYMALMGVCNLIVLGWFAILYKCKLRSTAKPPFFWESDVEDLLSATFTSAYFGALCSFVVIRSIPEIYNFLRPYLH